MSLEFLLDTNVLSEPLRPQPARCVLEWIEEHRWEAATAAPVWHELRFGCSRLPPSARRRMLETHEQVGNEHHHRLSEVPGGDPPEDCHRAFTPDELIGAARIGRVESVVRPYLEAMT